MLPKAHRLPLRLSRHSLESQATTLHSPFFTLKFAPSADFTQPTRAALIVSKKVASLATDRNRLRRRLSGQLATLIPRFRPGFDLIFYLKPALQSASTDELLNSLTTTLTQAGVLK